MNLGGDEALQVAKARERPIQDIELEHAPVKRRDKFWADDNDGSGRNRLRDLLMDQRENLGGPGRIEATRKYTKDVENNKI